MYAASHPGFLEPTHVRSCSQSRMLFLKQRMCSAPGSAILGMHVPWGRVQNGGWKRPMSGLGSCFQSDRPTGSWGACWAGSLRPAHTPNAPSKPSCMLPLPNVSSTPCSPGAHARQPAWRPPLWFPSRPTNQPTNPHFRPHPVLVYAHGCLPLTCCASRKLTKSKASSGSRLCFSIFYLFFAFKHFGAFSEKDTWPKVACSHTAWGVGLFGGHQLYRKWTEHQEPSALFSILLSA